MHLVILSLAYLSELQTPEELLRRFEVLPGCSESTAKAARNAGLSPVRVTVVQRFHHNAVLERNGVRYRFVSDGIGPELPWWKGSRVAVSEVVDECSEAMRVGDPSLVHLHGLGHAATVPMLRRRLPAAVPIVLQHHAEKPRTGLGGMHQRWALSGADGFFFAAKGLAYHWIRRRLINPETPILEIMEGSTDFSRIDPREARRRTGMDGSPVFLWVGRLDDNKDPLTVLAGLEAVLPEMPGARIYMAHGEPSPLEDEVRRRVAESEVLRASARLLGSVPHARMEAVFASADYFVLGSRFESSGFALAEALACGVVPIVTDIPSFRMMTDEGAIGALWPPGDSEACAAAVHRALDRPLVEQSRAAREFFQRRLSYAAIGRESVAAYSELLEKSKSRM